ncbi:MAG TPA: hypothetical protein VF392_07425 [Terracidiphilus sp.]
MSDRPKQLAFWRRHRIMMRVLAGACGAGLLLSAALTYIAWHAGPLMRTWIVGQLSQHFHARVELDAFSIAPGNGLRGEWGLWAEGRGLRIWPSSEADAAQNAHGEPLIRLDTFRFHAPLHYVPGELLHITTVRLTGLRIHIPPRTHEVARSTATGEKLKTPFKEFRVDRLLCNDATLVIEPGKPGKQQLQFDIATLLLDGIEPEGAMHFTAQLTNPRPKGTIQTSGGFGPWVVDDPGGSSVWGTYTFSHADLSTFHGIAGMLDSQGKYQGVLRDLAVDGVTDTPDFRLTRSGNPIKLHTQFHAHVDGTNGDTYLEPVDAVLGSSHFRVYGKIVKLAAQQNPARPGGHDIDLKVNTSSGRMEDFLRLASDDPEPLMTGNLAFNALLHIPPGPQTIQQRLELKGQFTLAAAQFTSEKVQAKVRELSMRGQGRPGEKKAKSADPVQSAMQSHFEMKGGVISLPDLEYMVPGADIRLKGAYTLEGGELDFIGTARMQATISQMVGGWKGFLLKPADTIFKHDGAGARIPVHIAGTRKNPDFGIDLKRINGNSFEGSQQTHPESPADKKP